MFIAIEHEIHDPKRFEECTGRVFPLPPDLHVHQFLPSSDLRRAVCLYEAPDIDAVRAHVDPALGDASTQRYFPVAEGNAIGLPPKQRS